MTDTVKTPAAMLADLSDSAPAHSTNRQMLRNMFLSGLPIVADDTARNALFPSPAGDDRVFNKGTNTTERYDAISTAWVPALSPVLVAYDSFERTDQIGLGTAPLGGTWDLSGAGVGNLQIQSGRYTMGAGGGAPATGYAALHLGSTPTRYGARFSFTAGGGGVVSPLAIISSADSTLILNKMLHTIISPVSWTMTTWNGASQNIAMATTSAESNAFVTPLATDGTIYECWITIQGTNVHIELPDGTTADLSDPLVPTISGAQIIYEHTYGNTSTALSRFESVAAYGNVVREVSGSLKVGAGFQGPIGSSVPSIGLFTTVGIGTSTPTAKLHIVRSSGAGDLAIFHHATTHAIVRIKRTASGSNAVLLFDQGQTNPVQIGSIGNGQDFQVSVGGSTRMIIPLSGASPIEFLLHPIKLTSAAFAGTGTQFLLGGTQQTTVGASGAASALPANPLGYVIAFVGTAKIAIPYYNG